MRDSLLRCGKPKTSMIEFDNSDITLRLTDYNNYPHRHRSRFDSNGDTENLSRKRYFENFLLQGMVWV